MQELHANASSKKFYFHQHLQYFVVMENKDHSKSNMQKVALTALAGTSIEWYDFFLYGAAAALIFPTAFFGEATPSIKLINGSQIFIRDLEPFLA